MRAVQSLVALSGVILVTVFVYAQQMDAASGDDSPWMDIEVGPSTLDIRGIVSSEANTDILQKSVARLFAGRETAIDVEVRPALPAGWALITDISLRALAEMRSASVHIDADGVTVRGMTSDASAWAAAAAGVSRNLLPGMTFRDQVVAVGADASLERQCIELFRSAQRGRKIEFASSSAALRSSAAPMLDELVQVAADCPAAHIDIKGHTDSTGNEAANVQLSQARADAVAAYLTAAGISPERITASGVGSAEPLVKDNSSRARQLNRRIDLELQFP